MSVLLVSNFAFAQKTNNAAAKTQKISSNSNVTTTTDPQIINTSEDPKVKLAIEGLRKKYPISLLDKKKKNYKLGQKINIDDYSIAEIKAAFLNADQNFELTPFFKQSIPLKLTSGITHNF